MKGFRGVRDPVRLSAIAMCPGQEADMDVSEVFGRPFSDDDAADGGVGADVHDPGGP